VATCVISATAADAIPAPKRDESERSLVQRAQRGDEQAFATLFQLHKKRVYSVCLLMTKDIAEAEDLTQEAFLQVFRSVGSFRCDSAFSTCLGRIAVIATRHRQSGPAPERRSRPDCVATRHARAPGRLPQDFRSSRGGRLPAPRNREDARLLSRQFKVSTPQGEDEDARFAFPEAESSAPARSESCC